MRTPVTFHVQNKLEKGEWESVSVFFFFFTYLRVSWKSAFLCGMFILCKIQFTGGTCYIPVIVQSKTIFFLLDANIPSLGFRSCITYSVLLCELNIQTEYKACIFVCI